MKILCSKDMLSTAISYTQRAVSVRSTLALLDGILFEADQDRIKLTGYDLETGVEATLPGDIFTEGSVVLNARMLGEIVRKLPEDVVTIDVDDNKIATISSGNSQFKIKGMDSQGYPKLPQMDDVQKVSVPQKKLKQMISQTLFAVSSDESRPAFNGILFNSKNGYLEMVAVDGFRLALRREALDGQMNETRFLIPGKALKDIQPILGDTGDVTLFTTQNHIEFDMTDVKMISRLIQQEFMNYNSILPQSSSTNVTVNTKAFYQAVERAALIVPSEDRRFPMNLTFDRYKTMKIQANTELGNLYDEVPVSMTGEDIDVDFNPRYFIDALKTISDEQIMLCFNGPVGPCVIRPTEGDAFSYLVLPLRK
ncbi:MAG: DNA polymerase III subunit beta [Negativicutes bacterium]|nr:DNA polymerase III subunit beta [Negativicutes bacterium]